MSAKASQISFRLPGDLRVRLGAAAERLQLKESTIIRQAVEAVVKSIEENGRIKLPIRMHEPRPESLKRALEIDGAREPEG